MNKSKTNQDQRFNSRLIIRPERENDYPKIREVNDLAFGQENEGRLIEKLRQTEKFIPGLSLVAELNDEIVNASDLRECGNLILLSLQGTK